MAQAIHNFRDCVRGDTWRGLKVARVRINGEQPLNTLSRVRMRFGGSYGTPQSFDSDLDTITISDPAIWAFVVPPQVLTLIPGTWSYDVELTDSEGTVKTYFKGVLKITPDTTI